MSINKTIAINSFQPSMIQKKSYIASAIELHYIDLIASMKGSTIAGVCECIFWTLNKANIFCLFNGITNQKETISFNFFQKELNSETKILWEIRPKICEKTQILIFEPWEELLLRKKSFNAHVLITMKVLKHKTDLQLNLPNSKKQSVLINETNYCSSFEIAKDLSGSIECVFVEKPSIPTLCWNISSRNEQNRRDNGDKRFDGELVDTTDDNTKRKEQVLLEKFTHEGQETDFSTKEIETQVVCSRSDENQDACLVIREYAEINFDYDFHNRVDALKQNTLKEIRDFNLPMDQNLPCIIENLITNIRKAASENSNLCEEEYLQCGCRKLSDHATVNDNHEGSIQSPSNISLKSDDASSSTITGSYLKKSDDPKDAKFLSKIKEIKNIAKQMETELRTPLPIDISPVEDLQESDNEALTIERAIFDISERIAQQQPVSDAQAEASEELLRATLEEMIINATKSIRQNNNVAVYKKPVAFLKQTIYEFERFLTVDEEVEAITANVNDNNGSTEKNLIHSDNDDLKALDADKISAKLVNTELLRMTPITTNIQKQLATLESILDEEEPEESHEYKGGECTINFEPEKSVSMERHKVHGMLIQINNEINTIKRFCHKNISKKGADAIINVLHKVRNHVGTITDMIASKKSTFKYPSKSGFFFDNNASINFNLFKPEANEVANAVVIFKTAVNELYTSADDISYTDSSLLLPETDCNQKWYHNESNNFNLMNESEYRPPLPPHRSKIFCTMSEEIPIPPPRPKRREEKILIDLLMKQSHLFDDAVPQKDFNDQVDENPLNYEPIPVTLECRKNKQIDAIYKRISEFTGDFEFRNKENILSQSAIKPITIKGKNRLNVYDETSSVQLLCEESDCGTDSDTLGSRIQMKIPLCKIDGEQNNIFFENYSIKRELKKINKDSEEIKFRNLTYDTNKRNALSPVSNASKIENLNFEAMVFIDIKQFKDLENNNELKPNESFPHQEVQPLDSNSYGIVNQTELRQNENSRQVQSLTPYVDDPCAISVSNVVDIMPTIMENSEISKATSSESKLTMNDSINSATLQDKHSDDGSLDQKETWSLTSTEESERYLHETMMTNETTLCVNWRRRSQKCRILAIFLPDLQIATAISVNAENFLPYLNTDIFEVAVEQLSQSNGYLIRIVDDVSESTSLDIVQKVSEHLGPVVLLKDEEKMEASGKSPISDNHLVAGNKFGSYDVDSSICSVDSRDGTNTGVTVSIIARSIHDVIHASLEEIPWGEVSMHLYQSDMARSLSLCDSENKNNSLIQTITVSEKNDTETRSVYSHESLRSSQRSLDISERTDKFNSTLNLNIPNYLIREGSTATITCEFNNFLCPGSIINWYKGNIKVELVRGKTDRISHDLLEVLVISQVTQSDSDIYSIQVNDDLYPVACLIIEEESGEKVEARFLSPPQTFFVMEGQPSVISCQIEGDNKVMWCKDRQLVEENERLKMETTDDGYHKIIIDRTELSDQGTYYAFLDDHFTTITLVVEGNLLVSLDR
ncbi:unnamed protein product [Dracunculus medinensis]|uniref:Ig-like domain-containing protein n=1 Tax=Dracunculus medinensis TaxID=318479 RepID=A0A0N4URS8_DRAME|nr:unnamed protein product [Dracunculus medinensis]